MKRIGWILILLVICAKIPAQSKKDTLERWMSKFYRLSNPVISENGSWAALRKRYDAQQDTLMVVNTQKLHVTPMTIVLNGAVTFLKEDGVLVFGGGKAEFVNLSSGIRKHFDHVVSAYPISDKGQYGLLSKDSVFSTYARDETRIHHVTNIQGLPATEPGKGIYLCRKFNNQYEVMGISGGALRKLAVIDHPVEKFELSPSGKWLFCTIKDSRTGHSRLIFVNTKDGRLSALPIVSMKSGDHFKVTEIQEGKAYWVSLYSLKSPEVGLVDIWYGNDPNLRAKKNGTTSGRYWLYEPEPDLCRELPSNVYPVMASLNNVRYFLAYHPTSGHKYLTYEPQFNNTHIYDIEKKNYRSFASFKGVLYGSPEIICSKNGEWVLGSQDGKKWTLFKVENQRKYAIDKDGLRNPVFSDDGQYILFESDDDLWKYDIRGKKLIRTKIAEGKMVKIVNANVSKLSAPTHIELRSVDMRKPLLLEITDRSKNLTSITICKNSRIEEIVSPTTNKVRNMIYNNKLDNIYTLEENYSMPPQLFLRRKNQKREVNFGKDSGDQSSGLLKQDIIHYVTADGTPLKGLLYYPVQYTPGKKYPMVVHVYQIQSSKSNEYSMPGYSNADGFDIRVLTERGYFVLLPDTVAGGKGAGLSALDCVNRALDAVSNNPSVDMEKVGLIGHSFGGYETNFIATQSNRFSAYVSGAGDSDIIQSYFSYNYHYPGPHYWQFENGIYNMPPFEQAKGSYFQNNPITDVEKISAPMLLWTGKKDQNVPWVRTMELFIGLLRNQKPVIALFYPEGRHTLGFNTEEKKDLHRRVLEWWDYFLKEKKDRLWIDKQMKKDAD